MYLGPVKRYENLHWVAWHPHQRLWNSRLVRALKMIPVLGRILAGVVVWVDSLILAAQVVARRGRSLGWTAILRQPRMPARALYVDCGTHREGLQVRLVADWFSDKLAMRTIAYEASPDYYESAAQNLANVPNVDLRQEALVGPDYSDSTVRLFEFGGDGKADSLFSERSALKGHTGFSDVPAVRLSAALEATEPDEPVLLRMNIEGAELYVIEDLVAAGMADRIGGYYGMWDDLSKIDPARDADFRQLLRRADIHPIAFNDRDLSHPLRVWAVRYDMTTSLAATPRA